MKKFLSLILSIALIITCVSINLGTVSGLASDAVSSDPEDKLLTIFDSNAYYSSANVNPNIETSENDNGLWLQNSTFDASKPNKDMLSVDSWKASNKILERNKAITSDLTDFEWNFDYLGNGTNTRTAFVFHVNDKTVITGDQPFWSRDYAFSLVLWGKDWSYAGTSAKAATDYAMPHSICMQIPVYSSTDANTNGKARPLGGYPKDETSGRRKHDDPNTYLELGDIDLSKWMKVSIKMVGCTITLTVTQGDITLTKEFTVSQNVLNNAPSGDLAIVQGGNSSCYKNMNVSIPRTIFNSNNYNSTVQKNPAIDGIWLGGNSWVSSNSKLNDSVYMGKDGESDKILDRNTGFDSVTDFEWQTQFISDPNNENNSADDMKTSFVFHINENSDISSFSKRKNVLAVTYYGKNTDMNSKCAVQNAFVIEYGAKTQDNNLQYMRPFDYNTKVTPWEIKDNSYKKLDDSSAKKAIDITKYVTLNIRQEGQNIKVSFWQSDDKENTYREFSVKMHKSALDLSPNGDFAIISRQADGIERRVNYRIKDMTIKTLDKDIDVPKPEEPNDEEPKPEEPKPEEPKPEEPKDEDVSDVEKPSEDNLAAFYIKNGGVTAKLLERNKATKTNVGDFEWQFDVIADNAEKANVSFVFHAGENADVFSYKSRNNLFAVTLFGTKVDETKNCAVSNALVVEYGGNGNNNHLGFMRPFNYDSKTKPWTIKEDSYLKLDSASAKKAIVTNKEFTVNIKMVGRLITVSTWQTSDKENTYRELNVKMHKSTVQKFLSGDFAVLNSSNSCGLWIKNMKVKTKSEIFNSNNYPAPDHINPSIPADSTDGKFWLGNTRISVITNNKDRLYMDSWKTSNRILERNKVSNSNVSDFEWSFDFLPNGTNSRSAFVFHVNDNSVITGDQPFWKRDNAFSLVLWGKDWSYAGTSAKAATDYAMPNSICMQIPDASAKGKARPLGKYSKDATTGRYKHDDPNTYLELGDIDLTKWVNITIKMVDNKVTLTVVQGSITLSKTFTVSANQLKLAPSGDFAVIQGGNQSGYRNMVVKAPNSDIKITEFDELAPTGTLYTNNFEKGSLDGIQFTYHNEEKTAILTEENGNKFLRAYPDMRKKEDGTAKVTGNGNLLFTFGPQNTMDFELTFKLRVKSNTHENLGSTIVGIHALPSNIKWDTVWFNILARGTSVSLKDTSRALGIDNLIAKTGKNRSGGTAYMPSDNRDFGVRPDGRWHDVKVVTKGYKYSLYVDGKHYLTATDKDETFYKGYTVIGSNGCIIDVDDISLTNK